MDNREMFSGMTFTSFALAASLAFGTSASAAPAIEDPGNEAKHRAMRALDAKIDAEQKLADEHQRSMVSPAPAGFKPEPAARRVRLRLVLEKKRVHSGSFPRFRLELRNVGREPIDYREYAASIFVKHGRIINSPTITFYLTDKLNRRKKLMPVVFHSSGSRASSTSFNVRLRPGETLHSIGDDDNPTGNFKTLDAKGADNAPGVYRLHVELDDRPRKRANAPSTGGALGPISSNVVEFEVVR